jgi:hypothetical protein
MLLSSPLSGALWQKLGLIVGFQELQESYNQTGHITT